jgi:hypothetical protein
MYGLALETVSEQVMLTKVGVEPSGDAFNDPFDPRALFPWMAPAPREALVALAGAQVLWGRSAADRPAGRKASSSHAPRQAGCGGGNRWGLRCLDRADLDQLEATNPAAALGLLRMLALDLGAKVTLCAQQLTLVEHL